jgi:hypothetical protein
MAAVGGLKKQKIMFARKKVLKPKEICFPLFEKQLENSLPGLLIKDASEFTFDSLFTVYYPSASTDSIGLFLYDEFAF